MRIGVFGGTFDPVHYGHLLLAECCREACSLDEVWFVPAAIAPHKQHQTAAPAEARLDMLRLAIGGHTAFVVSELEIERGGVTYTVDTLAELRQQQPAAEWFFLMGADSLADLPQWRDPGRICELAMLVVVRRPSSPPVDFAPLTTFVSTERLALFVRHVVDLPQMDLSSTDIRRRVAEGKSIRYRTPRAVEKYIEMHRLYRAGAGGQGSGVRG